MWTVDCAENPDWGFARNRQVLLRTPGAEYSTSVFTAPIEIGGRSYYGANRDYHWQGLTVIHRGELYKLLDGIYISPGFDLEPLDVAFSPSSLTYRYRGREDFELGVTIEEVSGGVQIDARASHECWYAIPADLTSCETWPRVNHSSRLDGDSLSISSDAIPLQMRIDGFDRVLPVEAEIPWNYKLGDGFREDRGHLAFREGYRSLYLPAELHSPDGSLRIFVPIPRETGGPPVAMAVPDLGSSPVARALRLRIETLLRYGICPGGLWFPEAGSFWFRKPWLRDSLEGIRWNLGTYLKIAGWESRVSVLLRKLLETAGRAGGLPLILEPGCRDFTSDAPPLLLGVCSDISRLAGDPDLLRRTVDMAVQVAEGLEGEGFSASFLRDGVICSPANSSWVDSVTTVEGKRWPTRLPASWIAAAPDPFQSEFGLVEVNAHYVSALDRLESCCEELDVDYPGVLAELSRSLKGGFSRHFETGSPLPALTVVPGHRLRDGTMGSPAVVAVAELFYPPARVRQVWEAIREGLLVNRSLQELGEGRHPFGVLVREGSDPYLGDREYHSSVVWPRDTPYLVSLMEKAGEETGGILVNNLDHMVSEGVLGYCGEIFSLPVGVNPNPSPVSSNPVPVKNPAQYWSHWCDPFLARGEKLGLELPVGIV